MRRKLVHMLLGIAEKPEQILVCLRTKVEYRKKFIHPKDGFVKLFCEEYDKSDNDE